MPLVWIGVFAAVILLASPATAAQGAASWETLTVDGRRALGSGRLDVAESAFAAALASAETTPEDVIRLATSLENLAEVYEATSRSPEAIALYRRAIPIWEAKLGPKHRQVAASLNNLAVALHLQKSYEEAEPLYVRCLALWEAQLGPDHVTIASCASNLAALYIAERKPADAEPLLVRAVAIREKNLAADDPAIDASIKLLAWAYRAQKKFGDAEKAYGHLVALTEKRFGPSHESLIQPLEEQAAVLRELNRASEALPIEERAKAIRAHSGLNDQAR